jgi:pimeloyl-ACP methyl ester carboxylesterase
MHRRALLAFGASMAGLLNFSNATGQTDPASPVKDHAEALLFQTDPEFWFETVRLFGATEYGGALFGEVLAMAGNIKAGDYDSWYEANNSVADRVSAEGEAQLAKTHRISARDSFLRAANYYRSSEFFLHGTPDDPRVKRAYERSVACYKGAAALFSPAIEPLEIPYEGTTLPGYFHAPDASGKPRPTLILNNGFDGSAEELHWNGARAAVERGYNVLAFDGPGQFGPLHRQNLKFRPDWEQVVSPVVDFALKRADVDPNKLALYGLSLGGYLAPRAAAFEPRLAACIADDGVYDYGEAQLVGIPEPFRTVVRGLLNAEHATQLDERLEQIMKVSSVARWAFTHGMFAVGAASPRAYLAATQKYHLRDGIAEKIKCPTLVCDAEKDLFFKGQAQELFDHLTCRKTMLKFTAAEGAGAHCELGAGRLAFARIYDWLDETLG